MAYEQYLRTATLIDGPPEHDWVGQGSPIDEMVSGQGSPIDSTTDLIDGRSGGQRAEKPYRFDHCFD